MMGTPERQGVARVRPAPGEQPARDRRWPRPCRPSRCWRAGSQRRWWAWSRLRQRRRPCRRDWPGRRRRPGPTRWRTTGRSPPAWWTAGCATRSVGREARTRPQRRHPIDRYRRAENPRRWRAGSRLAPAAEALTVGLARPTEAPLRTEVEDDGAVAAGVLDGSVGEAVAIVGDAIGGVEEAICGATGPDTAARPPPRWPPPWAEATDPKPTATANTHEPAATIDGAPTGCSDGPEHRVAVSHALFPPHSC